VAVHAVVDLLVLEGFDDVAAAARMLDDARERPERLAATESVDSRPVSDILRYIS
jgi:hypothetical protein